MNSFVPPVKRMPNFVARAATAWLPTRWRARIATTLSEYWSALRTRTGPRSSWSASLGVQLFPNGVAMSRRRLPGVSCLASNALA